MALMTYQQIARRNTDYAILLCFISGVVQLVMAVLNLGVLIDFISIPVTVGFTSATSVIIGTSQLKSLLGIKISSSGFLDTISKVFTNLHQTRWSDTVLGVSCIVVLMLLRVMIVHKAMNCTLWLLFFTEIERLETGRPQFAPELHILADFHQPKRSSCHHLLNDRIFLRNERR